MRSGLLQEGIPTSSAPACDALRGACTTLSVVVGWLASGALAVGGWWFTSTPSQSAIHGSAASDPLRAGVPLAGLRTLCCGVGWVAEYGGCISRCARHLEKSMPGFKNISIHRFLS